MDSIYTRYSGTAQRVEKKIDTASIQAMLESAGEIRA